MPTKLSKGYNTLNKYVSKIGLSPVSMIGFLVLILAPFYISDEFFLRTMVTAVYFGTLAMGFDLSQGYISVANWGYIGLSGLGGYVSALLLINKGITPWIGMIVAGAVAAGFGCLIGVITLKMNSIFTSIVSWFMGLALMSLTMALEPITRGSNGLTVPLLFSTPWAKPYYFTIAIIALIVFCVLKVVVNSKMGLAFLALGQDVEAAKTSGVYPLKYKLLNFIISCFISGVCGAFYAHFVGIMTPDSLNTSHLITVLVAVFLGGRGSIGGPFVAALILVPVLESMNSLMEVKYIIYGLILIVCMIYYPGGLAELYRKLKKALTKKKG